LAINLRALFCNTEGHTFACPPPNFKIFIILRSSCSPLYDLHVIFSENSSNLENSKFSSLKHTDTIIYRIHLYTDTEGLKDGLQEVPKGDKWSRRHFSLGNTCLHLKGISALRQCKNRL
jgi:hypothetical protein